MADIENLLRAKESELTSDGEVARILGCCPQDHFAVLQLNPLVESDLLPSRLTRVYRKKSLLIHPDKVKNPSAAEAFDRLKKAQVVLSSQQPEGSDSGESQGNMYRQKQNLISIYTDIAKGLKATIAQEFAHESNVTIREKVRLVLEQHEKNNNVEKSYLQRQELQKQNEIKSAEKDREQRKSWETRWEQDRDERVKSWRSYSSKVSKPKKKKKVLA